MEPILQAVQRAKSARPSAPVEGAVSASASPPIATGTTPPIACTAPIAPWLTEIELNWEHLEQQRIVSHNVTDPRARAYDVLRTQTLQSMDKRNGHVLGVTSPTEGCGKTVTSVNLALSIARQPERSVVLVDLDLQRPRVARCLGIKAEQGVVSVLSGKSKLQQSMLNAQIGGYFCPVLPAETISLHSSELIASRALRSMLQELKTTFPNATVIVDLPPVLSGDDVLSLMPLMDAFLLVAAVGRSTVSDVRESNKYLHSTELLRIVLNKSADQKMYYGAGAGHA